MKNLTNVYILFIFTILYLNFSTNVLAQSENTGVWKQYILDEGKWWNLGTFKVSYQEGIYFMTPINQTIDEGLINSRGLFSVIFSEDSWEFNSDWGEGQIGKFSLGKIRTGMYHGWAYFEGEPLNENLWILVKEIELDEDADIAPSPKH